MVHLDDAVIFTRTWEEHLGVLDDVLQRLRAAGLKASPCKCAFVQEELLYLGHLSHQRGPSVWCKGKSHGTQLPDVCSFLSGYWLISEMVAKFHRSPWTYQGYLGSPVQDPVCSSGCLQYLSDIIGTICC